MAAREGPPILSIGVTGHQVLPFEAQRFADARLREFLYDRGDLVGFSSLAAGADQLFAQHVLDAGGKLCAVLPSLRYRETLEPGMVRSAFDDLLDRASEVTQLPFAEPAPAAFLAAGLTIVERCDVLLAVWDGCEAQGLGGTADIVGYARQRGRRVDVIWPRGVSR